MSNQGESQEQDWLFRIDVALIPKLVAWMEHVDEKVAREQVSTGLFFGEHPLPESVLGRVRDSLELGKPEPYAGTFGDAYTYSFRPSSVGCQISVKHEGTGDEIVLTDPADLFSSFDSESDADPEV